MSNNLSTGGCSGLGTRQYVALAVLSSISGTLSVVACLVVIVVILLFKKFVYFTQRLILYLSIAALLNAVSVVLRLHRVVDLGGGGGSTHGLCVFTAALDQMTAWSELIAISCVTVNLLLSVLLLRSVEKLEWVYLALIFVSPLLFNWIPFVKSSYGEAGAWCWIRNQDEDCGDFRFGNVLRFILWFVPLYVILFGLLVAYGVIICRVQRLHFLWHGKFDPEVKRKREQIRSEFRPLIWYPVLYLFLNVFPLMNRIHDGTTSEPELGLWVLHAIFSPLKGGCVALAYGLDTETVRRLCTSCIFQYFRKSEATKGVSEYPAVKAHSDSLRNNDDNKNNPVTSVLDSSGHLAPVGFLNTLPPPRKSLSPPTGQSSVSFPVETRGTVIVCVTNSTEKAEGVELGTFAGEPEHDPTGRHSL